MRAEPESYDLLGSTASMVVQLLDRVGTLEKQMAGISEVLEQNIQNGALIPPIREEDIEFTPVRAPGQLPNENYRGITLHYKPKGWRFTSLSGKSQLENKEIALKLLRRALEDEK